ncbi:MAG: phosphonopyruvate decarboxylase [Pseudomonas sp.]
MPCSYLQPLINGVIGDQSLRYVPAANEGDAVAIAAGAQIGGVAAVAMMQNSGLGNAVNPLTSLLHTHRIPCLLIVTLRGDPHGEADEPQHELMGSITPAMLELMEIPWAYFPTEDDEIDACLDTVVAWQQRESRPYCLVMRKGSVASNPAPQLPPLQPPAGLPPKAPVLAARASRNQMLAAVQQAAGPRDLIVATTGYTGRELYALADRANQFYLVGAMGCASSVALGLALVCPQARVIVLDGDGALLMRMGAMATLAYQAPGNLVHVLLDNGMHESTGGQGTVSHALHLSAVAAQLGYPQVHDIQEPAQLVAVLEQHISGLTFVRAAITPGVVSPLPRPAVGPIAVTQRMREQVQGLAQAAIRSEQ